MLAKAFGFCKGVVQELRHVVWPSRADVWQAYLNLVLFVVVMTALIAGMDAGFDAVLRMADGLFH